MEATACQSVKETCYCENANDDEVSLQLELVCLLRRSLMLDSSLPF